MASTLYDELILEICLKLRIRAVTVFAFSIDNFSRSDEEVGALMKLAETRLMELCQYGELLQEYGVRIRFAGPRHFFPEEVREAMQRMESMTADHKGGVLNVCAPYTSRDEITASVRDTVQKIYDGRLHVRQVKSENIFRNMETCRHIREVRKEPSASFGGDELDGGKLDILVRTSDVKRLSDFMMWQASEDTQLHFVKTYWPDFGLTDMLPVILGWQQKIWLQSLGWW
ncbi:MAG: cis-prenyltransferase [Tremellales sp. Tagirdzhanova-0007]|nr:MAG: cis-prenyltransferase [Tremellales sp. Tagirdzhanova-0007]